MASTAIESTSASLLGPVPAGERVQVLDLLRGFALLGILVVNAEFFAFPMQDLFRGLPADAPAADYWSKWFVAFAAQGKFYSLFSFLFGLGFTVILERATARGVPAGRLYARRLVVLLAIGLVHGVLIWPGDILTMYALVGFLLLAMKDLRPRTLLVLGVMFLAVPVLLMGLMTGMTALWQLSPGGGEQAARVMAENAAAQDELRAAALLAYSSGGFVEVTAQRWRDFSTLLSYAPMWAPSVLGMFLIGAYFGKRRLLQEAAHHRPLFRRLLLAGLLAGLPASAYWATTGIRLDQSWPSVEVLLAMSANALAGPLMCLMYVSLFVLLTGSGQRLAPLASLGRTALSNYLLQSLVWSTVFYGYGLGLFGEVSRAWLPAAALGFWLLQIPLSHWWLRHFRFGPAEWLWRSLTYGRRQPMRHALQSSNSAA